jgi:hypothetical protein
VESNEDTASLSSREFHNQARPTGTTTVAGAAWQAYQVGGDTRAVVLTDPTRTIIVIGVADPGELEALAAAVR